jgi:hypothetical protein
MKYTFEMGSGAVIYAHTKFHTDWFRHSEVNAVGNFTHIHSINLLSFFNIRYVGK